MPDQVFPDGVIEKRDHDHNEPVDHRRSRAARLVRAGQVLGHERGGKRDRDHAHEQEQVEHEQRPVDETDVPEQRVVVHPHDADGQEAHHVSGVLRPRAAQHRVAEAPLAYGQQVEDQHRDGDGEDAVAE